LANRSLCSFGAPWIVSVLEVGYSRPESLEAHPQKRQSPWGARVSGPFLTGTDVEMGA